MRLLCLLACLLLPTPLWAAECVVVLHGLLRGAGSMDTMAEALESAGFEVINVDYPDRAAEVRELAEHAVPDGLKACKARRASPVGFVTHSMGGILLRQYLAEHEVPELGRVVMLGPPNQGSEAVDKLEKFPGFAWLAGPAGLQLGAGEDDLPRSLPAVDFELGVIAGDSVFNFVLGWIVPQPNDGPVAVASTRVEGMCAWVLLPVTHMFMMNDEEVIAQTLAFLRGGRFTAPGAENGLCRGRRQ